MGAVARESDLRLNSTNLFGLTGHSGGQTGMRKINPTSQGQQLSNLSFSPRQGFSVTVLSCSFYNFAVAVIPDYQFQGLVTLNKNTDPMSRP
ncbi:hypothetical protein K0M31_007875 [Melipona bicolor]|uniref:Uncharacterized protein n=1 Tax=Melipona bicolor TaxID=60889 RepID=A0AA40KW18_9HYME|nr:hypothetical protein K0M31_007875 [Melipona bicolor]